MSTTNNCTRKASDASKERTLEETINDHADLATWVLMKSMLDPRASRSSRMAAALAILDASLRTIDGIRRFQKAHAPQAERNKNIEAMLARIRAHHSQGT